MCIYLYGVFDGQVGDNGMLIFGYFYQCVKFNGIMWGVLVFMYSDGIQVEWLISVIIMQDWIYWNISNQIVFVEYVYLFSDNWMLKVFYNYCCFNGDEKMFYVYDVFGIGLDFVIGFGFYGYLWGGIDKVDVYLGVVMINGYFEFFGCDQEVVFGVSLVRSFIDGWEQNVDLILFVWGVLLVFFYLIYVIFELIWGVFVLYFEFDQCFKCVFGVIWFVFIDWFKVIVGVNYLQYC